MEALNGRPFKASIKESIRASGDRITKSGLAGYAPQVNLKCTKSVSKEVD